MASLRTDWSELFKPDLQKVLNSSDPKLANGIFPKCYGGEISNVECVVGKKSKGAINNLFDEDLN